MAGQQLDVRKTRDFSDNLNETFQFIAQNLKPLLTSFLGIAGVFMLISAIIGGFYYQHDVSSLVSVLLGKSENMDSLTTEAFSTAYFLAAIFSWISITAMQVVVACYMKVYDQTGRAAEIGEVWALFARKFPLLVVLNLVLIVIIVAGFLLCIFPGVYLLVALTPFNMVMVMEDVSFDKAFSRCFQLLKNQFWTSLGLYLVVYFIYAISSGIISSVIAGVAGVLSYLTTQNIAGTVAMATSILSIFSYVFYVVYYVSVGLHYFNLVERHDGTGILRRIETLGQGDSNFQNIQEEY